MLRLKNPDNGGSGPYETHARVNGAVMHLRGLGFQGAYMEDCINSLLDALESAKSDASFTTYWKRQAEEARENASKVGVELANSQGLAISYKNDLETCRRESNRCKDENRSLMSERDKLKAELEALKKPKDIRVGDIVTVTGYGYPCGPATDGKAYSFMSANGEVARVNSAWVEINTKAFPPGAYELSRECVTKIERPAPTPPQPKPGDTKDGLVFRTGEGWMEISRHGMRDRRKSNDRLSKEINRLGQDIPRTPEETYALKAMIVTARGLDPKSPQVITPRDPNRTDRRKK